MLEASFDGTWESWRDQARTLLAGDVVPGDVVWSLETGQQALSGLLAGHTPLPTRRAVSVPAELLEDARVVACHRNPEPWRNLYQLFYRVTHGERHILQIDSDPDVLEFRRMEKSVRRDIHKMHAFVRFRKAQDPQTGAESFVAWHRPDHRIVRINAGFFVRRFGSMNWSILTPDESVHWDMKELRFGPGVPQSEAPEEDQLEDLWLAYYASVFNPARVKVDAMVKELPVRHWRTLPEAAIIPRLLVDASSRVEKMAKLQTQSAASFVPKSTDLPVLRERAASCQGCDLFRHASQTVFGEGPPRARVVFVGEQPGDQEDLAGKPFVGPAGKVLNEALLEAGIDRSVVYVTNAVKHFKFTERGKRRIHEKPKGIEISACRPWLEAEVRAIQPEFIVCLGATAAQSVFGRAVRVLSERGHFLPNHLAPEAMVTIHPSALLRIPDQEMASAERVRFIHDLRQVADRLNRTKSALS